MITTAARTFTWTQGGAHNFTNGDPVLSDWTAVADVDQIMFAVSVAGTQAGIVRLYWSHNGTDILAIEAVEAAPTDNDPALQYRAAFKEWLVGPLPVPATPALAPPMLARPVAAPFVAFGVYAAGATIGGDGCTITLYRARQSPLQATGS